MKKQILTLTLCAALTVSSAMASTCTKKAPAKAVSHAAKTVATKATTPDVKTASPEELAMKKFQEKLAKDREDLYCKLGLTADQKAKAEALNEQKNAKAAPLAQKLGIEKAKLNDLKAKNAKQDAICKQESAVKAAKKDLRAAVKGSLKDFEAILTPEQLEKFHAIRAERHNEHCKNGHKCHFGDNAACPECGKKNCDCDKCKRHHRHHSKCDDAQQPATTTPAVTAPATTSVAPATTACPKNCKCKNAK